MAMLGEQYEQTIAEMLQKQSVFSYLLLSSQLDRLGSDPPGRGPGARVHAARRPTTARAGHLDRLPGDHSPS